MHNELFSIGPITIHGYGLMIGLGVAAALILGDYRAKKKGLNSEAIYGITFFAVVMGFLAAKILFILTKWEEFLQNPKCLGFCKKQARSGRAGRMCIYE